MKKVNSKMGRMKPLSLRAVALVTILIALFGIVDTAPAQFVSWEIGPYCVQNYRSGAGCTANDVRLEELRIITLLESCAEGTYGEMEAIFRARISANGSPDRYDIGFFVALDGESALLPGTCFHDYLEAPLSTTPVYGDWDGNGIPDVYNRDPAFVGYWNAETGDPADTCGDMETNTEVLKELLTPLRIPCLDLVNDVGEPIPDGFVDVGVCASWDNNQQKTCVTVKEAFPGTNSKCRCSRINLPDAPLAVDLVSFTAAPQGNNVLLTWETATEFDNLGFHLYRAGAADGPRTRLTDRLIPSQDPGSPVGATYTFVDETAAPGSTYFYWLEDVDVYGVATPHGPVAAAVPSVKVLPGRPRPAPGIR